MLNLSPRLKMAADMVRDGVVVADIGTDHAYLPAYLLKQKRVRDAIAADLREMPLKNAHKTLIALGFEDKIPLVISDGLDSLSPDCADDIVIAGMGGTLISEIISRCDWIRNPEKRLIIQPMSHAEDVRRFFAQSGFEIIKEDATVDSGRIYIAINAVFSGKILTDYPPSFDYIGKLCECSNSYANEHLKSQAKRLKTRADSLTGVDKSSCEAKLLYTIVSDIERCVENDNS